MTRGTFFLLAPVVVAAAFLFVLNGGEVHRADHFFFQVVGIAAVVWIFIGASNGIRCAIRNRQRK
jgi:undecaprenyl pyrophosphate phosphatase UppP